MSATVNVSFTTSRAIKRLFISGTFCTASEEQKTGKRQFIEQSFCSAVSGQSRGTKFLWQLRSE